MMELLLNMPQGSWLTETENGFLEPKYDLRFISVMKGTRNHHPLTLGEPGSLGMVVPDWHPAMRNACNLCNLESLEKIRGVRMSTGQN